MAPNDAPKSGPDPYGVHAVDARSAWKAHGFEGLPDDLRARITLVHAWLANWAEDPQRPVLHFPETGWITAGVLDDRSRVAAARLVAAGLQPGDRIVMSCVPCADLVVSHAAALRAGCAVVPVNTAFTRRELSNIAAEARAKLVIVDDPERVDADGFRSCGPDLATLPADDPASVAEVGARAGALRAQDPGLLVFTSGTTGRPKGATLSHGNLLAGAEALRIAWRWTNADRLVLSLPLFHMHGLGVGLHTTLLAGASAVVIPKFTPDAVLDACARESATMLFGVPTMWVRILESPRVAEIAGLRLCVSGSAALAPDVWHGLADRGHQHIVERYGMTETLMNASNPLDGLRRPGSVGLPLPGVELGLRDPGPDGVGEIVLRGPNVFAGYDERPDANAEAFTEHGWFRTGDLGRVDADGYVSIVGRSKDLIITGGFNVYPRDVEEVLRELAGVSDAAVVAEPSPQWGETVTACIVAASPTTADDAFAQELLRACAIELAPYQRPRRIVFVESFPRNALGKVVKTELVGQIRRQADEA